MIVLSEILPVYLDERLYLSVALMSDKCCIFGQVQKINYYVWKVCCGELRNLVNWPVEFGKICCGKLWSPTILLNRSAKVQHQLNFG